MAVLGLESTSYSTGQFGLTVSERAQSQKNRILNNNQHDPLFDVKSFTMPKPGIDGNPFGGNQANY